MIVIIISVLLNLDSIWGKCLKNIIGLTSNKILKQHFNITTNRRLIHIMSSVPEITVKGCWSPDQVFMRISMGETGQVNWSHIYILQIPGYSWVSSFVSFLFLWPLNWNPRQANICYRQCWPSPDRIQISSNWKWLMNITQVNNSYFIS